jgi:hypothetical protein
MFTISSKLHLLKNFNLILSRVQIKNTTRLASIFRILNYC